LSGVGRGFAWHDPSLTDTFANAFPSLGGGDNTLIANYRNRPWAAPFPVTSDFRQVSCGLGYQYNVTASISTLGQNASGPTVIFLEGVATTQVPGFLEYNITYTANNYATNLFLNQEFPPGVGPFTQAFLTALTTLYPQLYQATQAYTEKFLNYLSTIEPCYEHLLKASQAYLSENPITISRTGAGMNQLGKDSFDEISFTKFT
jgi:hypothetical protein